MASSCNISLRIPVACVFIGKTLFTLIKAILFLNINVSYPTGSIVKILAESGDKMYYGGWGERMYKTGGKRHKWISER